MTAAVSSPDASPASARATAPPLLEVRDLRSYFRTGAGIAKAVDGVSFAISAGETLALVGESGCGKSVTALSILQLLPRPAGYIAGGGVFLRGREISALPPVEMRKIRGNHISMVFQEPMTALNPVFTIGNQILETIRLHQKMPHREASALAIEMLGRVGIPDAEKRFTEYPHQMSGGMRQRVMIAMALVCRPEILVADEPTTALDVTIQSQILKLVRELQEEMGTAVLLITHDMGVVRENAHRVGVMYAGRIVERATQDELFANPSHPYTRLLLRSLPSKGKRDRKLATIEGVVPKATEFPEGCRFSNRCPFVMDRCRREVPPAYSIGSEHDAACFLLEDRAKGKLRTLGEATQPAPPSALEPDHRRLEVQGLKMHFPIRKGVLKRTVGHVLAVDGVDLVIRKGETLALVGESGCGKTTVGKCIVRLLDPTGGFIRFGGEELVGRSRGEMRKFRRRIQFIFQDPFSSLNPRLMIGETIAEGMETHGVGASRSERNDRIHALLGRVGLDPSMTTRYPHEFSGGQRQRIGLARALAVGPELVICDEATSSLDVSVQAQILNLLKDLQSELGLSYLFITHDLSVVQYLADRVSVMYLGRVVEEGTAEEIFQSPRHPYTRALLSAVPRVEEGAGRRVIVLEGDVPSPIAPPPGCHFHLRCPEARPECSREYPACVSFSETHMCRCILYPGRGR
jgi:peptide/nickel transport system ATP-binding protein